MKPTSSKSDFKNIVKDKLSEKSLSDKQLNDLHGLLNQAKSSKQGLVYAAAGFVVAILAMFIITSLPNQSIEMPQLIANEVVRNHLKSKPLDVTTQSYADVRDYFDKLKFLPINSLNIADTNVLVGGRYCSLQGYKAALLKIKDAESNKVDTLYQVPYVLDTFGALPDIANNENPIIVYERGIKVSIWVEKGILFARTHVDETK